MKKITVILLAIIFAATCCALVACGSDAVRVTLHVTDTITAVRSYEAGGDLPSDFTNGNLVLEGWYYDAAYDRPFVKGDVVEEGTHFYAKWGAGNSSTNGKVVVTLDYNYGNTPTIPFTIDKDSAFASLPVTAERAGYTFVGWYTLPTDGIKWSNAMPVSQDVILYAHWTASGAQGGSDTPSPTPVDLSSVFNKYVDYTAWNFAAKLTTVYQGETETERLWYYNNMVKNTYTYKGEEYTEYLAYEDNVAYWYYDNGDGTYDMYDENSDEFYTNFGMNLIYLEELVDCSFAQDTGCYSAISPNTVGVALIGEYEDGSTWTSIKIYVNGGYITKLVAVMSDGYTMTYEFSDYGQVSFTLPDATQGGSGGSGEGDPLPTEPTGVMDNQVYDADNFDNKNLQDKLLAKDEAIGLPSKGEFNVLVIPVQFKNDNITDDQLAKLDKAFNGNAANTGWESVSSYYQKTSYGQLKLTFDIQSVFQASQTSSYYETKSENVDLNGDIWTKDGSAFLLEEALDWCETQGVDLSKYDFNGDNTIDAVYLIYSAKVDYDSDDAFYWAYVTWYYGDNKYANNTLDAYYYLFAGFDFMEENLDKMTGVTINAETYIHETGHLLGLDDYYDYESGKGGNLGLGGADMMDYNVGDHGVYSKVMLGWITPEIVTETTTVTISSLQSQTEGVKAILIPLNFDNSYFCEYLLVDLYSHEGLNAMNAARDDTLLYGGASYGVRIYHVTSWAKNPYSNEYGSFTDYNNSTTYIPLVKLVEADGETSKGSSAGNDWAEESDLWQAGQTFGQVFANYMRNDGKTLNFDIRIDSVSADSATITVTYNQTQE